MTIDNAGGQATRRIMRLFADATDEELAYGLTWYGQAHALACELAETHGVSVDQVAGVIAALSPQTSWDQNIIRARQLLTTGSTYGLGLGIRKAISILAGSAPGDVLGGPKTLAFWSNIADPENSQAVTIDRHAYDAALGYVADERERKSLDRKGEYERIADIYRSAARSLGVAPHVAQAVVWAVWRNRYGRFAFQRVEGET